MQVFFSSSENAVLKQILLASGNGFSGQWKPFRSNISNISSIGSSFYTSWKYILNESFITASDNGFPVYWKRYSFIQIFLETITAFGGRSIFKKILFLLLRGNCFLLFFQIVTRMEVAFLFSKIAFFKESFILASGNEFPMLEIRCKPVFFDFFYS